jgi:hypothetical protein
MTANYFANSNNDLCKGKSAERIEQHKLEAQTSYHRKLQNIRNSWPQPILQSLKTNFWIVFAKKPVRKLYPLYVGFLC